jgi:hypothetical protein
MNDSMPRLRKLALRHPDVEEGVACAGTALEKRTVKARKKAFVFLGVGDIMLKLRESLPEATRCTAREPARYKVGANGWVKATFTDDEPPVFDLLEKWIAESYRLVVNPSTSITRKAAKKKPARWKR